MGTVDRMLATTALMATLVAGSALAQTPAPETPVTAPAPAAPAPVAPTPAVPPGGATTTPAPAASATPTPATETLTGTAAWERLKGNTITGKASGQAYSEFFDAAGGVKYVDKDGLSVGSWAVQNAKVCFDFPDDDDRSCSTFTVTGKTGSAVDEDGVTTRFDIEPGNSKGL